jgi:putative transposase
MPNHFHLLIQQLHDNGVSTFMQNLGNSYTRYFNTVNHRIGPIFQGQFKAVCIDSDELLLHISRYIHINPVIAGLVAKNDPSLYAYSSYGQYVHHVPTGSIVVDPSDILEHFTFKDTYEQFCLDQVDYALTLAHQKHLLIDID